MFLSVFRGHFALENFSQASKVQARYTLLHFDKVGSILVSYFIYMRLKVNGSSDVKKNNTTKPDKY